jgi:hypothetical protein
MSWHSLARVGEILLGKKKLKCNTVLIEDRGMMPSMKRTKSDRESMSACSSLWARMSWHSLARVGEILLGKKKLKCNTASQVDRVLGTGYF